MNVLSLFDGMSCGQIALERAGIKYNNYFASEIKKSAIKCTKINYPDTIHLGSVLNFDFTGLPKIDLLIGGSPCQDFSALKVNGEGLEGEKSKLFYEYLRVLKLLKPKYFLLENVRMKDASRKRLDKYLGVKGIDINSNLVSYQNRPRIYWTNIPGVTVPDNRHISFQDYIEHGDHLEYCKGNKTPSRERMWNDGGKGPIKGISSRCKNITYLDKIGCLTRKQDRSPNSGLIEYKDFFRYLSRKELEQAQNVPVGYTDRVSYNQAQDLLGDGWTVDVIAHIFKGLEK